jgi:outer membrane protease
MQEPVFWLFIEGSKQKMVEQKGDKNTNSRNNDRVKNDSSRIEGIHFMPKIAPK